jgi:hypothetical protein
MVRQIEDVNHALPDRLAFEGLAHGHGLGQRGRAAVLGFIAGPTATRQRLKGVDDACDEIASRWPSIQP